MGPVGGAHDPLTDPPPRGPGYEQEVACAGLMSALHKLGERGQGAAVAIQAHAQEGVGGVDCLRRGAGCCALHARQCEVLTLQPLQRHVCTQCAQAVYGCERLSRAFDIEVVAG